MPPRSLLLSAVLALGCQPAENPCGDGLRRPGELCLELPDVLAVTFRGDPFLGLEDVDADGDLDIISVDFSEEITTLLNLGDGHFDPVARSTPLGGLPTNAALGYFDGDGLPDLVINLMNGDQAGVWLLLGQGDGRFLFSPSPISESTFSSLTAGDWNEDGRLDLVTWDGASFDSYLGQGDGQLLLAQSIPHPAPGFPGRIASGDFNGDARLDLIATVVNGILFPSFSLELLPGQGDGQFVLQPSPPFELGLGAAAELTGDGVLDLIAGDTREGRLLRGLGGGQFAEQALDISCGRSTLTALSVGDINGDGLPDIFYGLGSCFFGGGEELFLRLNEGEGSFGLSSSLDLFTTPTSITLGDINGDGSLDLVVAFGSTRLAIFRSDP